MKRYIKNAISPYSSLAGMSDDERVALSKDSNAPIEQLMALIEEPDDTRLGEAIISNAVDTIALHKDATPEILRKIYPETDLVLQNPNCPLDILEEYANFCDDYHMYNIVCNPNAPAHLLHNFMENCTSELDAMIAAHPNTSVEDLQDYVNYGGYLGSIAKENLAKRGISYE